MHRWLRSRHMGGSRSSVAYPSTRASFAHRCGIPRKRPAGGGIYEDNNPARRLVVIANHDNDVAEYGE